MRLYGQDSFLRHGDRRFSLLQLRSLQVSVLPIEMRGFLVYVMVPKSVGTLYKGSKRRNS
jgi:hypothetical protein